MSTSDTLLIMLFIAVFLFYCYKKKKFIFSKLRKTDGTKETETSQNGIPFPNIYPFPPAYQQAAGYPFAMYSPAPPNPSHCKLVSVDGDIIDSGADIEHVINAELSKLAASGFTVQSVSVVSATAYTTDDGADKTYILFCITYIRS